MPNNPDKHSPTTSKLTARLEQARDALSERLLESGQRKVQASVETVYNVVFTGKLTLSEAQAVANMAGFFKTGADSAKRLLQAGRILKSYPNKAQADKLATLLTRAGAECRVAMEIPEEADAPTAIQKVAFALQAIKIPVIALPDYRQIGRKQWVAVGGGCLVIVALILWSVLRAPTLHGDSAADYEKSIERMLVHADPGQTHAIEAAIALLTESSRKAQGESSSTNPDTAARLIYAPIAGKTALEILALAEARLEKQRAAFRQGIADADQKLAGINQQLKDIAPGNLVILGKIDVVSAAFGWPVGAPSPTLAFAIRNNSSEVLMRVYLQGYLYDGTGKLLVSNPVTYSIATGIAPGSVVNATLPTQKDSPWAIPVAYETNGLTLKLRVANADNLQGKSLGIDYRPLEADQQRYMDWKVKVQAQLDAVKL
ncbi:MAG TPA: hypothetical protein VLB90_03760 [Pseudomonadales bacterium]|nr:hypothetical protein [Pseudomonadales bacterium]